MVSIDVAYATHRPLPVGELTNERAIYFVEVQMTPPCAFRTPQETAAFQEGQIPCEAHERVLCLRQDRPHNSRGGIGGQNLQLVLPSIETLEREFPPVRQPRASYDIDLVGAFRVDFHALAGLNIHDEQLHRRVCFSRLGVPLFLQSCFGVEVVDYRILKYIANVKLQVRDLAIVGRPPESHILTQLFGVQPVRPAVHHLFRSAPCDLLLLTCNGVRHVNVIILDTGEPAVIRGVGATGELTVPQTSHESIGIEPQLPTKSLQLPQISIGKIVKKILFIDGEEESLTIEHVLEIPKRWQALDTIPGDLIVCLPHAPRCSSVEEEFSITTSCIHPMKCRAGTDSLHL